MNSYNGPVSIFPDRKTFASLAESGNAIFVFKERIADFLTPVAILDRFYRRRTQKERSGIFLLESRDESSASGRFSYLGLSALKKVTLDQNVVRIVHRNQNDRIETIPHHGKPLEIFREFSRRFRPVPAPQLPDLPFGLVGYFTYEIVSLFEPAPIHDVGEEPLASFVVPDEMIVFDNLKQRLYLCVLAFDEDGCQPAETLYTAAMDRLTILSNELENVFCHPLQYDDPSLLSVDLQPLVASADFESQVEQVRGEIIRGEIVQMVLSQPFVSRTAPDPIQLYRAQRLINPSPYMFFLHFDEMILAGSSPETMVRLKHGRALLRPIAGTRHRGESEEKDRELANELLDDEKERAEHLMLVDLGRNDLGRVACPGTVTVDRLMYVQRYSHVMHLVSDISADLEETYDAFDLFRATFPAGTLTGAPKIRAMQLIHRYERFPRRCYGGAVGYIAFNGEMDFAITIRTASICHDELTVQAGAGIVFDSIPKRERQETINKAQALSVAIKLIPTLNL